MRFTLPHTVGSRQPLDCLSSLPYRKGRCQEASARHSRSPADIVGSDQACQLGKGLATLSLSGIICASPAIAEGVSTSGQYVPSPYSPGWEVYFGAFAAAVPFAIGSWEFGKRILIQRRCQRCQGSGLVRKKRYRSEMDVRKCPDCGGFFPWQGWKQFLTSTAAPGNGGPLQQPKGQNSIFYRVPALNSREDREGEVDSDFEIDEPVQAAAARQRKAEQKDPS